jgi:hypothetical protein
MQRTGRGFAENRHWKGRGYTKGRQSTCRGLPENRHWKGRGYTKGRQSTCRGLEEIGSGQTENRQGIDSEQAVDRQRTGRG